MKYIYVLILGIALGCLCFNYSVKSWNFPEIAPVDTVTVHDTCYVDSSSNPTPVVQEFPKVLVKSLDSISIDTISTVINGKVAEQKFKITVK
jgi:hypothetical protein